MIAWINYLNIREKRSLNKLKLSLDKHISVSHGRVHETEDMLPETPECCGVGHTLPGGKSCGSSSAPDGLSS